MQVIIIGKNRVEYGKIKKKHLSDHFFTTRNQLYKIYPDALTPMEVYHDGAWLYSESVIVFEENGNRPYHCKYPADYDDDNILMSITEHKVMSEKKGAGFFNFKGKADFKKILELMPWLIVGFVIFYALVLA